MAYLVGRSAEASAYTADSADARPDSALRPHGLSPGLSAARQRLGTGAADHFGRGALRHDRPGVGVLRRRGLAHPAFFRRPMDAGRAHYLRAEPVGDGHESGADRDLVALLRTDHSRQG